MAMNIMIMKKLEYPLVAVTLTHTQCDKVMRELSLHQRYQRQDTILTSWATRSDGRRNPPHLCDYGSKTCSKNSRQRSHMTPLQGNWSALISNRPNWSWEWEEGSSTTTWKRWDIYWLTAGLSKCGQRPLRMSFVSLKGLPLSSQDVKVTAW
jgi:hypothetical protein